MDFDHYLQEIFLATLGIVLMFSCTLASLDITQNQVDIKTIEEAGCKATDRLIAKGVCLLEGSSQLPCSCIPFSHQAIHVLFWREEVLEINQKQNRLKMDIQIGFWWEDARIKTNSSLLNNVSWIFPTTPGISFAWYQNIPWNEMMFYLEAIKFQNVYDKKLVYSPATILHVAPGDLISQPNWNFSHNSTFIYSHREYHLGLSCAFDFTDYPMDSHECQFQLTNEYARNLILSLFSFTKHFHHSNVEKHYEKEGFDIVISHVEKNGTNRMMDISLVGIQINMQRLIQPFLYKYYFPSIAIVCVSQVSFIIPPSSIPGRLGLVATQFLTLTNIFIDSNVSSSLNENTRVI